MLGSTQRATGRLNLAQILIENRVDETHPSRLVVEGLVRETLRDFVGTWRVLIRPARTAPWWVLLLERDDGEFSRTLLVEPGETREALGKGLLDALKGVV